MYGCEPHSKENSSRALSSDHCRGIPFPSLAPVSKVANTRTYPYLCQPRHSFTKRYHIKMIAAASTRPAVKAVCALPARGANVRALRARAPRVSRTSSRSSVTTRALAPEAMVSVGAATTGVQVSFYVWFLRLRFVLR